MDGMNDRHVWRFLMLGAWMCLGASAMGAERPGLGGRVDLPAAGISLQPFANYSNSPLPAIYTHVYTHRQTKQRTEAYDPRELWIRSQSCAFFKGESGTIKVVKLLYKVYDDLPLIQDKHVRMEDYRASIQENKGLWDPLETRKWVEHYTGLEVAQAVSQIPGRYMDYPYTQYHFKDREAARCVAYVIRLPARVTSNVFFFLFELAEDAEVTNFDEAAYLCMRSVKLSRASSRAKQPAKDLQRNSAGSRGKRRTEYEQTRQGVIANIKNLKDWWYVETPHYILTSNMTKENRELADLIQANIERVRTAYAYYFKPLEKTESVSVIRVFNRREQYLGYIQSANMAWSGGVWMPGKKELVISPTDTRFVKQSPDQVLTVVYHEAFHQYLFYALRGLRVPIWLNEGHAAYFEGCRIRKNVSSIQIKENQELIYPLLDAIKDFDHLNLEELIRMDAQTFYVTSGSGEDVEKQRTRNYALAWGLVYFLRKAAPVQYAYRGYEKICNRTIEKLVESNGDCQAAVAFSMKGVNMKQLAQDFVNFWEYKKKRIKAEKLIHIR